MQIPIYHPIHMHTHTLWWTNWELIKTVIGLGREGEIVEFRATAQCVLHLIVLLAATKYSGPN